MKLWMLFDYYWSLIRHGAIVADYFEYEFWRKSNYERKEYVTMLDAKRITKYFNKGRIELFNDKEKFNKFFAKYHKLKDWYFPSDKTEDDFVEWVESCNYDIWVKPNLGASGVGIYKPDVETEAKIRELYREISKSDSLFCEERFHQTGILNELNPSSLNTIRVYTLKVGNDIKIMSAGVRIGGGDAIVDNIHSGGMAANIDIETGIVTDAGYNLKGDRYLFHPKSKRLIPGTRVPRWNEILDMCKEASAEVSDVGFIGWDVAVSEEMVCLVEGNNGGNFDLPQIIARKGCKRAYFSAMKE